MLAQPQGKAVFNYSQKNVSVVGKAEFLPKLSILVILLWK